MLHRGFVGGMYFDGIVATQAHPRQLLVGEMFDHMQQARVGAEEILSEIRATLDKEFLILPIGDLTHTPHQQTVPVVADEAVPIASPNHLDHIPAGSPEN